VGNGTREGSLEAPTRHPVPWREASFYDESALFKELERVFDICHGCRRCFNLCNAFPTLFDAIDESDTGEVDGIAKPVYWEVVDQCYLCDMCYMAKCPYVPPHEWNVDFPHLMLRAKAKRFRDQGAPWRDRLLANTRQVGKFAGIPVVAEIVNAANKSGPARVVLEKVLGVDRRAPVPEYHSKTARKRIGLREWSGSAPEATDRTTGRVVVYTTCYGDRNTPELVQALVEVLEHNGIETRLAGAEACCGMPQLELGNLEAVDAARAENIPALDEHVREGWDIVAPVPSCVLMYKQELPLLFPDDEAVASVAGRFFDPFEYLSLRHRDGLLKTEFTTPIGKLAYQVPCHLRVQNLGQKTKDILSLVPDTDIQPIERCSGHDGTYGVKTRFRDAAEKIARPVARAVERAEPDWFTSDCPMAGEQVAGLTANPVRYAHPIELLKMAYGL
jgi:Fe-S oxidoreductase